MKDACQVARDIAKTQHMRSRCRLAVKERLEIASCAHLKRILVWERFAIYAGHVGAK